MANARSYLSGQLDESGPPTSPGRGAHSPRSPSHFQYEQAQPEQGQRRQGGPPSYQQASSIPEHYESHQGGERRPSSMFQYASGHTNGAPAQPQRSQTEQQDEQVVSVIRKGVIGTDTAVQGPFGPRLITYADYTASGRMLSIIEDYMNDVVYPMYANIHSEPSSICGGQSKRFLEEARRLVAKHVGADPEEHVIFFSGAGTTAAISQMIDMLGIDASKELHRFGINTDIPDYERPVVLIGAYEHIANEIVWQNTIADVVFVEEDCNGNINPADVAAVCKKFAHRPLRIGSFSAGNNVTGIIPDIDGITNALKDNGFLAFWDYAGAGAYVDIKMKNKDAIMMSPHKSVGGPGSAGVLVARKEVVLNAPQTGGKKKGDFSAPVEYGTPALLQAIRSGLTLSLKDQVGIHRIERLERKYAGKTIAQLSQNPNIVIVGKSKKAFEGEDRLTICSFNIKYTTESNPWVEYLHPHFVASVLNDLYGIQVRSGCLCSGPYSHRLFGMTDEQAELLAPHVAAGHGCMKHGWVRVNFNYFVGDDEVEYIIKAIEQVASDGWKLLPLYRMDVSTGQFHHRTFNRGETLCNLSDLTLNDDGKLRYTAQPRLMENRMEYLQRAADVYRKAPELAARAYNVAIQQDKEATTNYTTGKVLPSDVARFRWFGLASDVCSSEFLVSGTMGSDVVRKRGYSLAKPASWMVKSVNDRDGVVDQAPISPAVQRPRAPSSGKTVRIDSTQHMAPTPTMTSPEPSYYVEPKGQSFRPPPIFQGGAPVSPMPSAENHMGAFFGGPGGPKSPQKLGPYDSNGMSKSPKLRLNALDLKDAPPEGMVVQVPAPPGMEGQFGDRSPMFEVMIHWNKNGEPVASIAQ